MNDVITLIWVPENHSINTSERWQQSFAVDYLVNDCSYFLNGFESIASDPVPNEITHIMMDTDIPTDQYDFRILYYTPKEKPYPETLIGADKLFPNVFHPNGESHPCLQLITDTFSGYVFPLRKATTISSSYRSFRLAGFRLFRYVDGKYEIRAEFNFDFMIGNDKRVAWNYKQDAMLRLVNTIGAKDGYASALVDLDKFCSLITNKCGEPTISTIKTFEDLLNSVLNITKTSQIQNGRITGKNNPTVVTNHLTFKNRNAVLSKFKYRDY